jgi:tRNA (cmo5U34)-methyltransferase
MKKSRPKDSIYSQPLTEITDFKFDEKVAEVFPDMINRSVPGYATTVAMIGILARKFAQQDSVCYDLGCSLGAATLAMRHKIIAPNVKLVAVDNSEAMLKEFNKNLQRDAGKIPVQLRKEDVRATEIDNASVIVLNYTLQFIPPIDRVNFLTKVYNGLLPGGVLVLSEKITFANAVQDKFQTDLHHFYKKVNGYSDLEISQKRTALEKVLIPETISLHLERLLSIGFIRCEVWFQCFNFVSFLAQK